MLIQGKKILVRSQLLHLKEVRDVYETLKAYVEVMVLASPFDVRFDVLSAPSKRGSRKLNLFDASGSVNASKELDV
jgi:uncharacterized sporulation protein YeaH/YhbH (DUF444 family)